MFASRSLGEHLARGLFAAALLSGSMFYADAHPSLWLFSLPLALLALRGCPLCWTIGLVQTALAKLRGRARPAGGHGECGPSARALETRPPETRSASSDLPYFP